MPAICCISGEPSTGDGVNEERMNGSRPASASDWGAQ